VNKSPILLAGAGGHARACIDVVELEGRYQVAGLTGLRHEVGIRVLGYSVLGTDAELVALRGEYQNALVTVGQIKTPEVRMALFDILGRNGYHLPTIVSPRAYVSAHAKLGAGTIVLHGAVVNAGAVVGSNCIINCQALIEHDTVIGDHCHIATAAAINSGVRIGDGTFIGSNASVRQGTVIGERCVIGMGQRVLRKCEPRTQMPPLKGTQ
jgi:sugar O-acyltransferase (sialic acid O-acetyltransferase NeuD family)